MHDGEARAAWWKAHPWRWALGVAALALAVAIALAAYDRFGPRHTPRGQAPLVRLEPRSFAGLRAQFNAAADRTRLVVLLSPT